MLSHYDLTIEEFFDDESITNLDCFYNIELKSKK